MLLQPLCYAAEFWGEYRRGSSTLIGRLLDLDESLISIVVYGALLVRHLVLTTLFYDCTASASPRTSSSSPSPSPPPEPVTPPPKRLREYPYSPYLRHEDESAHFMNELSAFGPLEVAMENSDVADASQQRPARPRKQRPNSIAVDTVLQHGANSPRRPPPAEHLPGSPSNRVSFESPVSTSPTKFSHLRSQSVIDSPRRLNRLSMSFPVLPPNSGSSRPTSWANSPVVSPTEPSASSAEGNFLTQLASQERRVLELKEALRQAEVELDRLKRHWATHEALKKRADVRRVQALQPLTANLSSLETSEDDVDGSSQWLHKEMERRKALLSGIKTSNRKVFSGSKHTRTLSLLSPEKGTFPQPFTQPADILRSEDNTQQTGAAKPPVNAHEDTLSALEGQPKDVIIRTGKQMASDIKDGLWTFFEDIRQATIGEEATMSPAADNTPTAASNRPKSLRRANTTGTASTRNGKPSTSRTASNTSTTGTSSSKRDSRHDTLIDIGGSFWREHGVETPVPTSKQHKHAHSLKGTRSASSSSKKHNAGTPSSEILGSEPWDSWDTPIKEAQTTPALSARKASTTPSTESDASSEEQADSASDGLGTPLTDEHSRPTPRTSTSSSKRNSIPWPDLEKLTPSSLKRTASHLMKEWERSMTPSPSASEVEGLAYDTTPGSAALFGSSAMSGKTSKSD